MRKVLKPDLVVVLAVNNSLKILSPPASVAENVPALVGVTCSDEEVKNKALTASKKIKIHIKYLLNFLIFSYFIQSVKVAIGSFLGICCIVIADSICAGTTEAGDITGRDSAGSETVLSLVIGLRLREETADIIRVGNESEIMNYINNK